MTLTFFTVRAILAWLSSLSAKTIAIQVKSRVRGLLLDKLKALGPAYLQGEKTGELSRTIIEGVEALDAYFSQYLPQLVLSALVPLTILVFVFPVDSVNGSDLADYCPADPYFHVSDRQQRPGRSLTASTAPSAAWLPISWTACRD